MRLLNRLISKDTSTAGLPAQRRPEHVAVIMDGNGRWAKSRGLPRTAGHKKGADALRRLLNACRDHHIHYLTIYAFSAENWQRPAEEIQDLMQLLMHYLDKELPELHANNIRLRFIGDIGKLNPAIQQKINDALTLTQHNNNFHFTIALSYGSKQELIRAMQHLARQVAQGSLSPDDISENILNNALDTAGIPDPDLLIRTGGEQRLSNFLLWQSAYTELYFTDTLWPDFTHELLNHALNAYAARERRFGTTSNTA